MAKITNELLNDKLDILREDLQHLQTQVHVLVADYNRRKGIMAVLYWAASLIGGILTVALYKIWPGKAP